MATSMRSGVVFSCLPSIFYSKHPAEDLERHSPWYMFVEWILNIWLKFILLLFKQITSLSKISIWKHFLHSKCCVRHWRGGWQYRKKKAWWEKNTKETDNSNTIGKAPGQCYCLPGPVLTTPVYQCISSLPSPCFKCFSYICLLNLLTLGCKLFSNFRAVSSSVNWSFIYWVNMFCKPTVCQILL